ncbi:MAG: DivIVA domain-containing protein [Rhodothermaceae bacterium]|nr:DivIVA domain-containing protein [Rhodothermaceae bacterium]
MKLTPLDIKKQEFTRAFRGVDPQEVQSFLQMVADQWSSLLDENARMEQKVRDLDSKLEHYRKIEEALQEALETARDNSHKTIENAQREAQIIIREARGEAEELRKKGSQEHKRLKHDITKISGRRDEVIARLRAFLMSEMELLARFEGQDQLGASYVRLHPTERKQLESRSYMDDYDSNDLGFHSPVGRPSPLVEEPSFEVDIPLDEIDSSLRDRSTTDSVGADSSIKMPYVRDDQDSEITLSDLSGKSNATEEPDDLSSDELDFIKSTVNTSKSSNAAKDLFKATTEKKNGHASPSKPAESYTLNDRFNQDVPPTTHASPSGQSNSPGNLNQQHTKDGWVVRPVVDENSGSNTTDSSMGNKGFASIFGSENDDDLSATPEEIEKIRRILNDLD